MEKFEAQKNREEIISDVEIDSFRNEVEKVQKETQEKVDAKEKDIHGLELVGLDLDKLTKPDWFIYKLFKEGKLNTKILSYHRKELGMETTEILEKAAKKKQNMDYTKLPREQFLAWIDNKFIAEEARKKLEKRMKKAA